MKNFVILISLLFVSVLSKADDDFGYTKKPDMSSADTKPVLQFAGDFDVSSLGAATYTVPIDVPAGVGGMQPSLSLAYSSQSSFGLAGFGFNLSGLSTITRGPKSVWQDGTSTGIMYKDDDAFYLDGERLVREDNGYCLVSNHNVKAYRKQMRVYVNKTEYDKYKKIPEFEAGVEQRVKAETRYFIRDWVWEVVSEDGTVSTYQCVLLNLVDDNSIDYYISSKKVHRYSWVLTRVEDKFGNSMTVDYDVDNKYNFAYPKTITYGDSRNTVNFVYENLYGTVGTKAEIHPFSYDNKICAISRRIKSIVCKTENVVYCSYDLSYNVRRDVELRTAVSQLSSIRKANGLGEMTEPIMFSWGKEPFSFKEGFKSKVIDDIPLYPFNKNRKLLGGRNLLSADINGDGISDVIEIDGVRNNDNGQDSTYLIIYVSKIKYDGSIGYNRLTEFVLEPAFDTEEQSAGFYSRMLSTFSVCFADFNCDGIQDLFIPYYGANQYGSYYKGYFIYGSRNPRDLKLRYDYINLEHKAEFKKHNLGDKIMNCFLPLPPEYDLPTTPLFATCDIDNDGVGNYLILESVNTWDNGENYGYKCYVGIPNEQGSFDKYVCFLNIPSKPKDLFVSDYNKDGMLDIMVAYDGGYSIYYNKGIDKVFFSHEPSVSGNTLGHHDAIREGDFDGDGLADYFYMDWNGADWHIAYNNGGGKFESKLVWSPEYDWQKIYEQSATDRDNGKFGVLVFDADCDGKSDILVQKAQYTEHKKNYILWKEEWGSNPITHTILYRSNGERGKNGLNHDFYLRKGEYGSDYASCWCVGDFDKDGRYELMHYYDEAGSAWFDDTPILAHTCVTHSFSTGNDYRKINKITDAMDNTIDISYEPLTNEKIYTRKCDVDFPVVDQLVPMDLVSTVTTSNGGLNPNTTEYHYTGLKYHTQGRGILGFDEITSENNVLDVKTINRVDSYDSDFLTPSKTSTESYVLSKNSLYKKFCIEYQTDIVGDNGCYFHHPVHKVETDMYGHTAEIDYDYDAENRVLCKEHAYSDGDKESMYKCMEYFYPNEKEYVGALKPDEIWEYQLHSDATEKYGDRLRRTKLEYDSNGLLIKKIENYGTDKALTTETEYDALGYAIKTIVSGADIKTRISGTDYDLTHRFVEKTWTEYPDTEEMTSVTESSYDIFGHCLSTVKYDDEEYPDTTFYEYDGWGNLVKTTDVFGNVSTVSKGWGTSQDKKYYVLSQGTHTPWVKTWYDSMGREVEKESVGAKDIAILSSVSYDEDNGNVVKRESSVGKKKVVEKLTYDDYGRVVLDEFSTGQFTKTEYKDRSVTITTPNGVVTKTFDSWGNPKTVDDNGNLITYTYNSFSKPAQIVVGDDKTVITYDENTGDMIKMQTSDRGTVEYKYNSLGECIYTKDAVSVTQNTQYDELGRVTEKKVGTQTINYNYGTSGSSTNKLTSKCVCDASGKMLSMTNYSYDDYGRVSQENRYGKSGSVYQTEYEYNEYGELQKTRYWVSEKHMFVSMDYKYDCYGNKMEVNCMDYTFERKPVWRLYEYTGKKVRLLLLGCNGVESDATYDDAGRLESTLVDYRGKTLSALSYVYDAKTGDMIRRKGMLTSRVGETFGYDSLGRLETYVSLDGIAQYVDYSSNGNITWKSDYGTYDYAHSSKPHRLTGLNNEKGVCPLDTRQITYNAWNRVSKIKDSGNGYEMLFEYDEDGNRNWSKLTKNGAFVRETEYIGNMEHVRTTGGDDYFIYLGDNLMYHFNNHVGECLYLCTDNIGSIVTIINEDGDIRYEAKYDAWGNQEVVKNDIGFIRGYTGHEEMPEFGLVNMNARLYDPMLGRFLSPDNFVQMPENSQNYNRYAYCLNNPLKYNDPSGNFIQWPLVAIAAWEAGWTAWANGESFGKGAVKGAAINLASQGLSYGIGEIFGHTNGSIWNEAFRAGAHGITQGALNAAQGGNFWSGFASGSLSSIAGSASNAAFDDPSITIAVSTVVGGLATLITDDSGNSFFQGAMIGFNVGCLNHCGGDNKPTQKDPEAEWLDWFGKAVKSTKNAADYCADVSSNLNDEGWRISKDGLRYFKMEPERFNKQNYYVCKGVKGKIPVRKLNVNGFKTIAKRATYIGYALDGYECWNIYTEHGAGPELYSYFIVKGCGIVCGGLSGAAAGLAMAGCTGPIATYAVPAATMSAASAGNKFGEMMGTWISNGIFSTK